MDEVITNASLLKAGGIYKFGNYKLVEDYFKVRSGKSSDLRYVYFGDNFINDIHAPV